MTARRRPTSFPISRRRFLGAATATGALVVFGCSDEGPIGTTPTSADSAAPDGGTQGLTQAEIENLLYLREEEKLARDVYLVLGGTYGKPFTAIETSEQSHMDAVLALLGTYGLEDPAALAAPGEFTNPDLKALYDQLVAEGSPSELAALGVGCFIEDYDINDIELAMAETTHPDILGTLENLQLGSRNHLRSFYSKLTSLGGTYTPRYIDQATFESIVSSPSETP